MRLQSFLRFALCISTLAIARSETSFSSSGQLLPANEISPGFILASRKASDLRLRGLTPMTLVVFHIAPDTTFDFRFDSFVTILFIKGTIVGRSGGIQPENQCLHIGSFQGPLAQDRQTLDDLNIPTSLYLVQCFPITIVSKTGTTSTIQAEPNESILQLKQKIVVSLSIPLDQQCLVFANTPLVDDHTVTSYAIQSGSTINIVSCPLCPAVGTDIRAAPAIRLGNALCRGQAKLLLALDRIRDAFSHI
jgi:large subunit ribosomal protein L40e